MELSIISVNWNATEFLRECIHSIYEQTKGISFEIIVVDNASPDRSIEQLPREFPDVKLVLSSQNLGFSRANNLGSRRAAGEFLLFLNPDTRLVNPAINSMLEQARSLPDAGIVGCRHVSPDMSVQTSCIQKFPTILNQLVNIEVLRMRWPACPWWDISPLFAASDQPSRVEVISGACLLIRREAFERVGNFSEDYFMYAEDIDLNYKVARLGLRNYFVPTGTLIHYGGKSSSQNKASQWATLMQSKAMLQFYAKTRGRLYAFAYRMSLTGAALGRLLLLGIVYPFVAWSRHREARRAVWNKWAAILKWSVGLGGVSV